jgi:hypothetical protein
LRSDEDADNDDERYPHKGVETTDTLIPYAFGKEASPTDRPVIAALVKRYYVAAATGNGNVACQLLDPTLADGLGEGQSTQGGSGGCTVRFSALFTQQHRLWQEKNVSTMTVIDVRLAGDSGVATVGFRTVATRRIFVKRNKETWKINALFDTGSD